MTNLTVKDLPLFSRATRERWPMSTELRSRGVELCKEVVADQANKYSVTDKLRAVNTMARLDTLNLRHEEIFTPKIDVALDLTGLSDEEILKRLKLLEQVEINQKLPSDMELLNVKR